MDIEDIEDRKLDHINICSEKKVQSVVNYWNNVLLMHKALPEINYDDIVTEVKLYGKTLNAPIIIGAITGGCKKAYKINKNLAIACEKLQLGLQLGSERPLLKNKSLDYTYKVVCDWNVPLVIGNIGVTEIIELDIKNLDYLIDVIDADCIAIHLNYLQECLQFEGKRFAKNALNSIKKITKKPILVKETGCGISLEVAKILKNLNVGVDVGGYGGTNFALVEYYRAKTKFQKRLCKTFSTWGIPTYKSILYCKEMGIKPLIGSGGIRTGIDGCKALVLGTDCFAFALPLLKCALRSSKEVIELLETIIEELKIAMFLLGIDNITKLKTVKYEIL